MPFLLSRLLARFSVLTSWATPVAVILFVFGTSWPLMALAEPAGSELVRPGNYWWYFVITTSTVGYGDFFPETVPGRVVGAYVVVGGITALTTVFTKIASVLERRRGRRMQGSGTVDAAGHVVLIGYTPGRTERIAAELLADTTASRLVLCAWDDVGAHPMADQPVDYVRGDLTDDDVLRRAGVHRAAGVLVDARDDNEALAIALAVDHLTREAHTVVTLRDLARTSLLGYIGERIRCIQWHTPRMITEELQSPGIAEVYAELMTHGGANTYSVTMPEAAGAVRAGHLRTALGRRHGATLLAARTGGRLLVNPGWDDELTPGAVLYYVGSRRLTSEEVAGALRA